MTFLCSVLCTAKDKTTWPQTSSPQEIYCNGMALKYVYMYKPIRNIHIVKYSCKPQNSFTLVTSEALSRYIPNAFYRLLGVYTNNNFYTRSSCSVRKGGWLRGGGGGEKTDQTDANCGFVIYEAWRGKNGWEEKKIKRWLCAEFFSRSYTFRGSTRRFCSRYRL